MSDLYRSALQSRISKLPQLPITDDDEEEDEDAEGADSLGSLPGFGPPAMTSQAPRTRANKRIPNAAFSPLSGADYFVQAVQVAVPSRGLDVRMYYTPASRVGGAVIACHHGAGYSGLSFACFAKEVSDVTKGEVGVLALDARRHGKTTSTTGEDEDLSLDVLTQDFAEALQAVFPDPVTAPSILLVGHSMGAAVVVRACPTLIQNKYKITGVAALDVVEGTALEALAHMDGILNARPVGFDSPEDAIEWHVRTNTIKNPISARVSVPSIIKPTEIPNFPHPYEWRTGLRSTAPYWSSWFTGLSSSFLAVKTARLLVLAGADRLDRELMIGQMQGKFQMLVVAGVGHMLHEDDPTRLAEILVDFWRRNERVVAGVKKVGET